MGVTVIRSTFRLAAPWVVLVGAALALVPQLIDHPAIAYALPAALAAAVVFAKRPALGAGVLLVLAAAPGLLLAYTSVPLRTALDGTLAALWLSLAGVVLLGRQRPGRARVPIGVGLLVAYLGVSLVQAATAGNGALARDAFEVAQIDLATVLLVAYARWPRHVHRHIARTIVFACLLAGAYATLRHFTGPTTDETAFLQTSKYNYVDGHPKLIGSFPDAADLGLFSAFGLAYCLAYVLSATDRWRWAAGAAIPLLVVGLFGSDLRSGIAAAMAAALVVILLHQLSPAMGGLRTARTFVALVLAVVLGGGGYLLLGSGSGSHSLSAIFTFSSQDESVAARQYKWDNALRDLGGHPAGFGLGTAVSGYTPLAKVTATDDPGVGTHSIDSGYLKVALEQGLAVTALFVAALLALLATLARLVLFERDRFRAGLALGGAGALTVLLIAMITGAWQDGLPAIAVWMAVGLGLTSATVRVRRTD